MTFPIIDCFLYNNELELLELRYHVLSQHVSKFVVIESNHTFQGHPRQYKATNDAAELGLPIDRFVFLQVDVSDAVDCVSDLDRHHANKVGRSERPEVWTRQRLQRDAILQHLPDFPSDAVFLMGDVDEIPRPSALQFVASMLDQNRQHVLKLPLVMLEGRADQRLFGDQGQELWWDSSLLMCRWQQLLTATPTEMRSETCKSWILGHAVQDNRRANDLGWHFSWMGDRRRRAQKAQSCAHGMNINSIDNVTPGTLEELSLDLDQPMTVQPRLQQQRYPLRDLPPEIWQLPRVQNFLLPDSPTTENQGNFVSRVLCAGGKISSLLVPSDRTNGTGLFNPTILVTPDQTWINIRHCQYTLFHSELGKLEHEWGPLLYLHPENDCTLTTTNYLGHLKNLDFQNPQAVDTSELDEKPLWEFVGLEDVRMVQWDKRLYFCGVRRDTTPNGQGRMELSEIDVTGSVPREISRRRMPAPGDNRSYCEKNWMPVLDLPYTFVKWCNPTEVVRYDPSTGETHQIHLGQYQEKPYDFRGGSQVLPWGKYRIAVTHVAYLSRSESGRKDGTYRHVLVVWDQDWNVVKYGEPFSFLDNRIEFCCGMAIDRDRVLLTFGIQDNAAYVLEIPQDFFSRWINE
jgi:hypothetical protein